MIHAGGLGQASPTGVQPGATIYLYGGPDLCKFYEKNDRGKCKITAGSLFNAPAEFAKIPGEDIIALKRLAFNIGFWALLAMFVFSKAK